MFRIESKAGVPMGIWPGGSKAEALAAMHRDAGYACTVKDGDVHFLDDTHPGVAGYVEDWIIEEVDDEELEA